MMAAMGYRTFNEMIGQMQMLDKRQVVEHWKAKGLDFSKLFHKPDAPEGVSIFRCEAQDHKIHDILDRRLIAQSQAALERGAPVRIETAIRNTDRTAGAMLSGEIAKRYGHEGLPHDTIHVKLTGTAGQSFGAWLARGVTFELEGDANDYVGKGLSGGRIIIRPTADAGIVPEESIIVGNTVLYGAIEGECYFRGVAGERFAVRNSGAIAVIEGAGDHCCEYMTGGVVVVLGRTGRNFAAGMSGGIAYVLDEDGTFEDPLQPGDGRARADAGGGRGQRARLSPRARSRIARPRRGAGRPVALRRRAAASPDHAARALHRLGAGGGNPRRLEEILPDVPQGDAGRVPPRARRDGKGAHDAGGRIAYGQDHRFPRIRTQRPRLRAGRGAHQALARIRAAAAGGGEPGRRRRAAWIAACPIATAPHGAPTGCPVNNQIPDWNDLVYRGNWEEAARNLHSTNNFPEVTGRVCPAPCEASCTLNIDDNPVTIKTIECAIADRAIAEGWVKPEPPSVKTGKKVAVVGSGPAGLACAQQLARAGHDVHVFEKYAKAGGLLRYGIPDFKMEKHHVDKARRADGGGRRDLPLRRPCRRERAGRKARSPTTTRSCSRAAPRRRATCRSRAASSRASISPWTSCRSRTGA